MKSLRVETTFEGPEKAVASLKYLQPGWDTARHGREEGCAIAVAIQGGRATQTAAGLHLHSLDAVDVARGNVTALRGAKDGR
jgi:hypothetical protein